jgi:hypothetical protein
VLGQQRGACRRESLGNGFDSLIIACIPPRSLIVCGGTSYHAAKVESLMDSLTQSINLRWDFSSFQNSDDTLGNIQAKNSGPGMRSESAMCKAPPNCAKNCFPPSSLREIVE